MDSVADLITAIFILVFGGGGLHCFKVALYLYITPPLLDYTDVGISNEFPKVRVR